MSDLYVLTTWPNRQHWGVFSSPEEAMAWVYYAFINQKYHGYGEIAVPIQQVDWHEDYLGKWTAYPKGATPINERPLSQLSSRDQNPLYEITPTEVDYTYPDFVNMMNWAERVGIKPMASYFTRFPYNRGKS